MSGSTQRLLAVAAVASVAAACADLSGTDGNNTLALGAAFQTVPAGFSSNSSTFDASGDAGVAFFPGNINPAVGFDRGGEGGQRGEGEKRGRDGKGERDHHDGFGEGGIRGLLMGGGLGPDFIGAIAFGKGRGRGPFGAFNLPSTCTFDDASGLVTCPDRTERGFTIKTQFAFEDEAGAAQAKFDTLTTNSVNVKIDVSGTKTRHEGSTSTLHHSSDRTVAGLAPGKTEREVNGVASAHESTTGTRDGVSFTAVRDVNDTTTNLVIPIVDGRPTIPSSGTVIRNMTVSITPEGGTATTKSRREEVTFDGTNVISVKITQDGTTKNCTITLPGKRLVCEE
jgi:hypothetical protein